MSYHFRRSYSSNKSWGTLIALIGLAVCLIIGSTLLFAWLLQIVVGFFGIQLAYWQALLTWALITAVCSIIGQSAKPTN